MLAVAATPRDQAGINLEDLVNALAVEVSSLARDALIHAMVEPGDNPVAIPLNLRDFCWNNPELCNGFIQNPTTYLPLFDDALDVAQDIVYYESPVYRPALVQVLIICLPIRP